MMSPNTSKTCVRCNEVMVAKLFGFWYPWEKVERCDESSDTITPAVKTQKHV